MTKVFEELLEVCFHPNNMELMKKQVFIVMLILIIGNNCFKLI